MRRATVLAALAVALAARPAARAAPEPQGDFGQLARYHAQNLRLAPASAARPRVVFIGDSITEGWDLSALAGPALEVLNRGIGGQTTPQMLVRFRQDVIALRPAVVHVLAGTNDLAGNTGPATLEAIEDNLLSMVEIARANHVRVVLGSVPPALDFPWRPGLEPAPRIRALNAWLHELAARRGLVYADYWGVLADAREALPAPVSADGVHPNQAGYAAMTAVAARAIERALQRP
jgi:acyl-CoA thioesterase I